MVLETLSIIAYRQPVTKMEIEKIRGVKSDHAVNRLVEYDLVYEAGRLMHRAVPPCLPLQRNLCAGSVWILWGELPDVDPEQEALIRAEVEEELQLSVEELPERYGGIAGEKNQVPETDAAVRHFRGQMGIC